MGIRVDRNKGNLAEIQIRISPMKRVVQSLKYPVVRSKSMVMINLYSIKNKIEVISI